MFNQSRLHLRQGRTAGAAPGHVGLVRTPHAVQGQAEVDQSQDVGRRRKVVRDQGQGQTVVTVSGQSLVRKRGHEIRSGSRTIDRPLRVEQVVDGNGSRRHQISQPEAQMGLTLTRAMLTSSTKTKRNDVDAKNDRNDLSMT